MPRTDKQGGRALLMRVAIAFALGAGVTGLAAYAVFSQGQQNAAQIPTHASEPLPASATLTASMPVLAVRSDGTGSVGTVDVEIIPGKGRVLVNTNPFVEPDTQYSAESAVAAAEGLSGKSLADRDVILTFNAESDLVGGPSAGAAMALAVYSAITGKKPLPQVAITGTVDGNGVIGQVGGVPQKAEAAAQAGFKLLVVPRGQMRAYYYEQAVRQRTIRGFTVNEIRYVPRLLDLDNYTMQWGMVSTEAQDIARAADLILQK